MIITAYSTAKEDRIKFFFPHMLNRRAETFIFESVGLLIDRNLICSFNNKVMF